MLDDATAENAHEAERRFEMNKLPEGINYASLATAWSDVEDAHRAIENSRKVKLSKTDRIALKAAFKRQVDAYLRML